MPILLLAFIALFNAAWSTDLAGPIATPAPSPATTATTPATAPLSTPKVAYIPIHTDINPLTARFLERTVADARTAGAQIIVVHITSPGGRVDTTMEMTNVLLSIPKEGPELVAFIDEHAFSAAALIAYCHQRIYLTPRAAIGDIGVIFQGADGKMEYAPEKMETVVRGMLRNAAQNRGWNEAKLVKMTARNQKLWRVDLGQGPEWIIGDDLPAYLLKHAELEQKDDLLMRGKDRVGAVISGEDRLQHYTAKEAIDEKMATGLVDDLDALYTLLGTTKTQVIDLSPTTSESVSWTLAGWAPLLAGLAVLFIVLEFKMPGGLFISLAAVAGVAFFICQFYQDLASNVEVIIVLLGLVVVALDVFVLPTGGWLSAIGLMTLAIGLVLSFMPDANQFKPDSSTWGHDVLSALSSSLMAFAAIAGGLMLAISAAPRLKALKRISVDATIGGTSDAADAIPLAVGERGITRTGLSPAGFVTIADREISASSQHSVYIAAGSTVEVVEKRFGEVVVRLVDEVDKKGEEKKS